MSNTIKFSGLEGPERLIGSRVLEFELTSVLGSGGMSVVYRGVHRVTQQEVAIKILPPELATHDELKARFVEEARVLARLEHPNIVALNNFVEAGGRLCLIMLFVDGVTFEKRIQDEGRLDWREVYRTADAVLQALEYAHANSVVHRDIKPSNILIRKGDGVIKVTDFGIAKMLGHGRLTSTGQTMGTVRYMSPEQVRGKSVDLRSDLYSLGVTMYEGLTGNTPFDGENQFDIMQQHLHKKPPPLAKVGLTVPPAVEKVLMRSLEKDPKDRFQDAASFRAAIAEVLPLADVAPKRPPSKWGGRALALGLGLTVAGGAGGALYFVLRPTTGGDAGKPQAKVDGGAKGDKTTDGKGQPPRQDPKALWPPHVVPGLVLGVDETFADDGLRVQSASSRIAQKADARGLRDRYLEVVARLKEFMQQSELGPLRAASKENIAPMTLVLVRPITLDTPSVWPGFVVRDGASYPSRYVAPKRTLFLADGDGWERKELPYGVALHRFAPIRTLSGEQIADQAEKFAAYFERQPLPAKSK